MVKTFFLKAFLLLFIVFLIDRVFVLFNFPNNNLWMRCVEEKIKYTYNTYFKQTESCEILLVGDSHSQFGFDAERITELTQHSCYNFAFGGMPLSGLNDMLKEYSTFKKLPKVIICGIDYLDFKDEQGGEFNPLVFDYIKTPSVKLKILTEDFRFFASRFSEINKHRKEFGEYLASCLDAKTIEPLPIHQSPEYDLEALIQFDSFQVVSGQVRGYGIANRKFFRYDEVTFEPSERKSQELSKFIRFCKDNNITLVFVEIPEMAEMRYGRNSQRYADFMSYMDSVKNAGYPFAFRTFNDTASFDLNNPSYFFDSDHLNHTGARIFTDSVVAMLKEEKIL